MKKTKGFFDLIFGKMDKGTPSHQLRENELSDTKNMQPSRAGWIQRKGISELTTTSIDTGVEIKNAIHFQQLNLGADEIIAHAYDAVNGERILRQTTLPPSTHTGASWSELKALTTGCDVSQFAIVGDALVMANNKEFQIYRGPSQKPYGVYFYDHSNTAYIDWYDELTDDDAATVMILDSMATDDKIYVITLQPASKLTITVAAANVNAVAMVVKDYNGSYNAVTSLSDGTETGGDTSLGQSGDVTWTLATDEIKTFIQGQYGYCYEITFDGALDAEVEISAIDVYSDWNDLKNIWAGEYLTCIGCLVTEGAEFEDYTGMVNNDFTSDVCVLSSLTTATGLWYLAFAEPVSTIQAYIVNAKGNDNAAVVTVKYGKNDGTWSSGFTVVGGTLEDTCVVGGDAIKQSGYLRWTPPSDEKPTIVGGELQPKYWYQISFSANLDAEVEVYYIEGVPAMKDPDYSAGVFAFKRRAVQIAPKGIGNALRYSAANLPNVFNGNDSGYIYFGERPLKAGTHFFNEGLIFADTEMWFIQGNMPANFGTLRLSAQVGIDAPLSLIGVEIGVMVGTGAAAIQRKIICWIFRGLWMFDGVRWWKISSPDIDPFWDPDHDDYINTTYANRSFGAFDFETELCYWIIYSGSGQTTPNKVVVLHPITLWYGIYEYDQDISCILSVANGLRSYLCGGGHSSSKLYRMNDTKTDVNATGTAVAIEAFVVTRDIWSAYDQALKERLVYLGMESQIGGQVKVYGFPDGSKTEQEIGTMSMIERGKDITNKHLTIKKNWPGEHTVKLKFLNETSGIRWRPYSAKINWDPAEPDSK